MILRLEDIEAVNEDQYEVTVSHTDGGMERFLCRVVQVVQDEDLWIMETPATPKIFLRKDVSAADGQAIVAAVLAYHEKRVHSRASL